MNGTPRTPGIVDYLKSGSGVNKYLQCILVQVKDRNPYYESLNMDDNMDTRVVDNNPGYGKH